MLYVRSVLRVGVGLVFLAASLTKLHDLGAFRVALGGLELFPAHLAGSVAVVVVYVELIVGAFLLLGIYTRPTLAATCILVCMFIAAVGIPLLQGRQVQCGCFGSEEYATAGTVVRQFALLAAAMTARGGKNRAQGIALDSLLAEGQEN